MYLVHLRITECTRMGQLPCKLHLTDRCSDRWCDLNRRITGQKGLFAGKRA